MNDCDLVITTYTMLTRLEWLRGRNWRLVVLDEAQAIRNSGTRQSRAVKELRAEGRIALTGTPVENRLSDLWSLFDFLNPGLLGGAKAFGRLTKQMAEGVTAGGANPYGPLRTLVRPYILRRLKTDKRVIADLPEKSEVNAYCGLSRRQAALYEQAVRELEAKIDQADGIKRRGIVLASLMRLKQICNHPSHGPATTDMRRTIAESSRASKRSARNWRSGRKRRWSLRNSARLRHRWPIFLPAFSGGRGWSCTARLPLANGASWWRLFSRMTDRRSLFFHSRRVARG